VLLVFSEMQNWQAGEVFNELIFVQERNANAEMWTGRRLGKEGAREKMGFQFAFDGKDFESFNMDFSRFDKVLFFNFRNDVRDERDGADLYDLIRQFKEKANFPDDYSADKVRMYDLIRTVDASNMSSIVQTVSRTMSFNSRLGNDPILKAFVEEGVEVRMKIAENIPVSNLDGQSLNGLMATLREVKTPEEIDLLRKAVSISAQGQVEVMKAMHPDMSEREVQGIHEFVYKRYGSEAVGYGSIVGAGENGCILHYVENSEARVGDRLVLMDLGAQYRGYTADVTRTIPASGKFSPEERAIYQLVYDAQEAGFNACMPGNSYRAPHAAARKVIDEGLVKLGIVKEGERHNYFPHGTSHYLGLDVHDRGTGCPLKPNSVITVEPGIYIPEGSPCDPKWWGIGVRIEDDILITETGWENLSAGAPRKIEEIEALMKQSSPLGQWRLPGLEEIKK
jgi:Xaa-Pro aminopeptidase